MEINKLIEIVKEKITKEITLQKINVEDKSFLHKNHIKKIISNHF